MEHLTCQARARTRNATKHPTDRRVSIPQTQWYKYRHGHMLKAAMLFARYAFELHPLDIHLVDEHEHRELRCEVFRVELMQPKGKFALITLLAGSSSFFRPRRKPQTNWPRRTHGILRGSSQARMGEAGRKCLLTFGSRSVGAPPLPREFELRVVLRQALS